MASRRRNRPRTFAASSGQGRPLAKVGLDPDNRAGIDWGVYGVPETFVVRGDGKLVFKLVGPITAATLNSVIQPQIVKAME